MTLIPVGFGQINYRFTGTSVPNGAEVTLGFSNVAAAAAAAIVTQAENAWDTSGIEAAYVNTCTMSSILVKLGPNATGPSAEGAVSYPGTLVAAGAPPNVAMLIHKTTDDGGRRGRGRWYLPGVAETDVDVGGDIAGVRIAAVDVFLADLLLYLDSVDLPAVLLHGDEVLGPSPITSMTVDARAATQRRRLRG